MPVSKTCTHCDKLYRVSPSRAKASCFCSNACRIEHKKVERRELKCEHCDAAFVASQDHGVWPKFCSRECFLGECIRPEHRECQSCGSVFLAKKSGHADEHQKYCSKNCAAEGLKRGEEMACTCCGRMFYLNLSTQRQRSEKPCCSQECSTAFYRESRSPNWKGGEYVSDSAGHKFERHERPGYVGKYVGSHRLVAGAAIGRDLKRCEVVLRINNNKADDRPENLFICESSSEALKRVHGSLPWPTKTNLTTFINQQEKA